MKLGVLIITYNSAKHIGRCLAHCQEYGLFGSADVLVVDNASQDKTVEVALGFGDVQVVANPENRGFAGAVNQGFRVLDADFVLLLNPDAYVQSPIDSMLDACRKAGVAACGGRLVDKSGRTQTGFQVRRFPTASSLCFEALGLNRLWPGNPVNRHYRCLDVDPMAAGPVQQPAGAFLLIRRDAWATAGGFDERFYPLWFEEVDFLKRVSDLGMSVQYVPDSIALHEGAHSLESVSSDDQKVYWYGSLIRYVVRHFKPITRWGICLAVITGLTCRTLTGIVQIRSLRPVSGLRKVLDLTVNCLLSREPLTSFSGSSSLVGTQRQPSDAGWKSGARQALNSGQEKTRRSA